VEQTLRAHFRPEFLNRVDETVIFKPLDEEQLELIVEAQLEDVKKRLEDKKVILDFESSLIKALAEKGFDPLFGARPLKRVIQTDLLNVIAKKLLSQEIKPGQHLLLGFKNGQLTFSEPRLDA